MSWVGVVGWLQSWTALTPETSGLLPASMVPALSRQTGLFWLVLGMFGCLLGALCEQRVARRMVTAGLGCAVTAQIVLGGVALVRDDADQIWRMPVASSYGQLRGTYVNSNHLAFLMLLVLPLALGLARWALSRWRRSAGRRPLHLTVGGLAVVGAGVLLVSIVLTGSRTAMLISLAMVLLQGIFWLTRGGDGRGRGRLIVGAAGLLLALLGALWIGDRRVETAATGRLLETSVLRLSENGRWPVYRVAAHKVVERPVWGAGLGSFRDLVETDHDLVIAEDWWHAHSDPLELLTNVGLLGTVPLVGAWLSLVLVALRLRPRRSEDRILLESSLIVATFAPMQALVDFPLSNPANAVALVGLLAIVQGLVFRFRSPPQVASPNDDG